jgi:hypothetical protein
MRDEDSTFIDEIGPAIVAGRFKITPQRLHMWRVRGIPGEYRGAVAALATDNGVAVPEKFLEPRTRRARPDREVAA